MYQITSTFLMLSSRVLINTVEKKYYKIIIDVAFSAADDGDFQIRLFSDAMLSTLDKIFCMYKGTYKKLLRI